jgi:hypothetical protein
MFHTRYAQSKQGDLAMSRVRWFGWLPMLTKSFPRGRFAHRLKPVLPAVSLLLPLLSAISLAQTAPNWTRLIPQNYPDARYTTIVGLYQFNVIVPPVAAGDRVPLTFDLGGTAGAQTLFAAIRN